MNVTLVLYESRYGTGEKIARTICPILGPARAFNIEDAPKNLKYYSNIVFLFSLYGYEGGDKTLDYIKENNIDWSKFKVGTVCVGIDEKEGLKKIKEFKGKIKKDNAFEAVVNGDLVVSRLDERDQEEIKKFCNNINRPFKDVRDFRTEHALEAGKQLRYYFTTRSEERGVGKECTARWRDRW